MTDRLLSVDSDTKLPPAAVQSAWQTGFINPAVASSFATVAATKVSKDTLAVNVKDYGAVGDGTTDDTAAIQAAIDAATAMGTAWSTGTPRPVPTVYAAGIFKTTGTITITCPVDLSQAVFWCYQTTGVAVQVGSTSSTLNGTIVKLPQVFSKVKTINGWSQVGGTTGVRVTNLYSCQVWVNHITYFETGFWGHANGVNGSSYNEFHLQRIYGCKVGVKIAPNDTGSTSTSSWFNTNLFFGGVFGMSPAEGTQVSGTRQVLISACAWPVNDNKFYGMSLETNDAVEYMIDCYGRDNVWERCRFENTATVARVIWRASSFNNIITRGINTDNISYTTEAGAYNFGQAYGLTRFPTASRPDSIGAGGLAADVNLNRPIYSPDGLSVRPLALQDETTLSGEGSPEGVVEALPGAIYTRIDAGVRTNLCKYPIGGSVAATTGWAAIGGTLTAGSGYLRNTLSANAGASARYILSPNSSTFPATASTTYTMTGQTRMSAPLPCQMRVQFYNSSLVATGSLLLGTVFTPGTSFGNIPAFTVTSPSDAAWLTWTLAVIAGPANSAGDTMDLRQVIFEKGLKVGSFFDGSSTSGGSVTYAWTGTAQASTSTATYTTSPTSWVKTGQGNTGWLALASKAYVDSAITTGAAPDIQTFTSSGTWTKPTGYTTAEVICIGGGAGGGSGRRGAAGTVRCGGGGGAGGGMSDLTIPLSALGSTVTVTIGAAGSGGAAVTADDTNGNNGVAGGATTFGSQVRASGGNAGSGGTASTGTGGGASVGAIAGTAGASASATGAAGGGPGAVGGAGQGGAAGGGITSGNAASNGGAGVPSWAVGVTSAAGGVVDSTSPGSASAASSGVPTPGGSGGGGASSTTTAAQAGAAGGIYGGGGSGGGASLNGNNSGAGGAGAAGICVVICR